MKNLHGPMGKKLGLVAALGLGTAFAHHHRGNLGASNEEAITGRLMSMGGNNAIHAGGPGLAATAVKDTVLTNTAIDSAEKPAVAHQMQQQQSGQSLQQAGDDGKLGVGQEVGQQQQQQQQ
jgi:hypothetical protein